MKPPKPVKAFKHKDVKRAHIPSAEEAGYEADSPKVQQKPSLNLPLNPVITRGQDPELLWMHKYSSDEKLTAQLDELQAKLKARDLSAAQTVLENLRDTIAHRYDQPEDESLHVDIRSLYRHEHIAPETLIKSLYRIVVEKSSTQDELFSAAELFGNAIGHEELDKVSDYYTHSDGWTNRLIQGDSLLVMTSLLEREGMTGQVQCIYLDPPYGIKYGSNWQIKLNNRTVKDGDDESLSGQPEQVKAFRDTWELGIHSYLTYLRERLLVARQLLHESGSCFVQISDENVHLVRNLMDEVFGSGNFSGLIFLKKTGGLGSGKLKSVADYLIWYAKEIEQMKYRPLFKSKELGKGETTGERYDQLESSDGMEQRPMTKEERDNPNLVPKHWRAYQLDNLTSGAFRKNTTVNYSFGGETFHPGDNACWKTTVQGLDRLTAARRIQKAGGTLRYKRYLEDFPAVEVTNLWDDVAGAADKTYVVQTSTSVVERCVLMTTDPGDLVLDPTCGSGTTAYVAEQWGRRWIATDTSRIALNIAKSRLMTATFPYYLLYDSEEGRRQAPVGRVPVGRVPRPGDSAADAATPRCDLRQGFIYKKVPHVTLGSIANNEPPSQETLYDQPEEDKKRLRVAGPFTVETLQSYEPISPEELTRQRTEDKELGNFEDLIFAHLKSAGVKTGIKEENAVFLRIDRLSQTTLHAEGWFEGVASAKWRVASEEGKTPKTPLTTSHSPLTTPSSHSPLTTPLRSERKAYLHIGPKFGTVSKQAVTEAIKACRDKRDGDWLLILGFAFESGITELSRSFGNFQVSIVRMHDDLLQLGLLKKDKKAASFVTIGEPDIRVSSGEWLVSSDGRPLISAYECEILSGLGSLEAINGLGRDGLLSLAKLAEGGNLRTDQPSAAGGSVRAIKHSGRRGQTNDRGVSASAGALEGFSGGVGNSNDSGATAGVSAQRGIGEDYEKLRRDQPDAFRARQVAALQTLAHSSFPLATSHYALVTIEGLDIYDPIKDEVKSRDVHDIAYWMLDDHYDGSNFVVRQVFFCGGDKDEFDEWKKGLSDLAKSATKRKAEQTLKIQIDDEAFARIYGHKSHPFPITKGQKIAVRVISQFGEETTKVLEAK